VGRGANGRAVAVVAPRGVAGAIVERVASRSRSSHCVWCRGRGLCAARVLRSRSLCRMWGRGRGRRAACGVPGVVVVSRVVLRVPSSRRMGVAVAVIAPRGCRGRRRCAACGVAVAVFVPRVASRSRSSRRAWYPGYPRCAACGIAVAVVVPCGVAAGVAVVAPRRATATVTDAARAGAGKRRGGDLSALSRSVVGPGRPSRESATRCVPSHCGCQPQTH